MIADAELPVHQGTAWTHVRYPSPCSVPDGIEASPGVVEKAIKSALGYTLYPRAVSLSPWRTLPQILSAMLPESGSDDLRHLGGAAVLEQKDRGGADDRKD